MCKVSGALEHTVALTESPMAMVALAILYSQVEILIMHRAAMITTDFGYSTIHMHQLDDPCAGGGIDALRSVVSTNAFLRQCVSLKLASWLVTSIEIARHTNCTKTTMMCD